MDTKHMTRRTAIGVIGSIASVVMAQPQNKVIRVVAPFQAGTGSDALLRVMVKHVSQTLGQPVIVDNKPGADGAIAGLDLENGVQDGSTLLFGNNTSMSAMFALKKKPPYDPVAAFSTITQLGFYSAFLFVNASLPIKSVQDLIGYAKSHPNELKYGTAHATARIASAQLAQIGGLKMIEVPYKGEPALMTDIITGRIDLTFASSAVLMPHVATGKLRVLAILPRRAANVPDVPTMAEAGVPGFNTAGWAALFGPRGMGMESRNRIAQAFAGALKQQDVLAAADQIQFTPRPSTPVEMERFLVADVSSYKRIVSESGIEIE